MVSVSTSSGRAGKTPSTRVSLLDRLRKGADAAAWQLFVDLYTPLVYRFARRKSLQDADAQDVAQKVMARVYKAIGKFAYDSQRGRFRNWLGVITLHEIARHRDQAGRVGKGYGEGRGDWLAEQMPGPDEGDWFDAFNAYILTTALSRIRPHFDDSTWQAFELTWVHDVETREAASQMNKTTGWIYKARFRVLKRLRHEVEFLSEDAAALQQSR
jgi:RNA polymerase sigma factor (sigma-70 family)